MKNEYRRSHKKVANALIAPMLAVVALCALFIIGLTMWSARVSNTASETAQMHVLAGALHVHSERLINQQINSVGNGRYYPLTNGPTYMTGLLDYYIGRRLSEKSGFEASLLIVAPFEVPWSFSKHKAVNWTSENILEQLKPAIRKTRGKHYVETLLETPVGRSAKEADLEVERRPVAETGFILAGSEIYIFSSVTIIPGNEYTSSYRTNPAILISFKKLDTAALAQIASEFGLVNLTFSANTAKQNNTASFALEDPGGNIIGHLYWDAARPGTNMQARITPVLVLLLLGLLGLAIGVMSHVRQSTKRLAVSEAAAVHTALHDALSGLPNRERFKDITDDALLNGIQNNRSMAVIYIDLDRFKDINDTLGHAAGDRVICDVSNRIGSVLPTEGVVARISGDEFAILLQNCANTQEVERFLKSLQDKMGPPVRIGSNVVHVGLSMGVALAPVDGDTTDELLRKADIALYNAKASGRGRWSFFSPSMMQDVQLKDEIARELRIAIERDKLDIAYQPQLENSSGRVVAVEALVRWPNSKFGSMPPSTFVPIAEECGLINSLGLWVLRRACRDSHQWPELSFAVNVSPTNFKHPRFVESVIATLEEFDVNPRRLEIEVTESVFVGEDKRALKSLEKLKELGITIALDDFGSGYSSLSYLRHFPFDTLKIDRDFVSSMNDSAQAQAILKIIIQLGNALGMTVVGEGVEERVQLEFLKGMGCDRTQGYYVARPLCLSDLVEFLQDQEFEAIDKTLPTACTPLASVGT